jgi:hypothetical protein
MPSGADRNLLLGMLALQMRFVARDGLIGAMQAWTFDRDKPLGEILVERGLLMRLRLGLVEQLVAEHLADNGGDLERSLAAVGDVDRVSDALAGLGDAQIEASLVPLRRAAEHGHANEATIMLPPREVEAGRFEILRPHAQVDWASSSWPATTSSIARSRSRKSYPAMPTIRPAGSASFRKPRSPGGWNIRASCPSMAWASMPTVGRSTP